jgi:hypothetical protein
MISERNKIGVASTNIQHDVELLTCINKQPIISDLLTDTPFCRSNLVFRAVFRHCSNSSKLHVCTSILPHLEVDGGL